mmetsp:Transcript_9618/g.39571  ORF Transcript_9618/g.39571 Transcript_9618/m.39571 type:complete len:202 (-) Transcript_9618:126-731(-)
MTAVGSQLVLTLLGLDPVATHDVGVDHVAQHEEHIGFEGGEGDAPVGGRGHALLQRAARGSHQRGQRHGDFDECARLLRLIVPHSLLLHELHARHERALHVTRLGACVLRRAAIQHGLEAREVVRAEPRRRRRVKVRLEAVHKAAHRVALGRDAEHAQLRGLAHLRAEARVHLVDHVVDVDLLKEQRPRARVDAPGRQRRP